MSDHRLERPSSERLQHSALALCALAVAAGALIRLIPCFGDFWLDEIWSWFRARRLQTASEVFSAIHDSNNHYLNTLIFYALGDRVPRVLYRLPSFAAGTASIALAAAAVWRRGRIEAVFASVLTGSCYALVHFSSEARGYALAVLFALLAFLALGADLDRGRRWGAPVFAVSVVLGFLSHLVFLFFWAGALAQSAQRLLRVEPGPRALARLARLHAFPLACWVVLYQVDLRQWKILGGSPTDYPRFLARTVGFSVGLPVVRSLAWPYAALALGLLALALVRLRRQGDDSWILHAVTLLIAPLAVLGALRPEVVDVRYFLIGIAFALLLAAAALADLYRSGRRGRIACAVVLSLFVLGNAVHIQAFLRLGRGGYSEALAFMAQHTTGSAIEVASDHDFRTGQVLRFYARDLPPGKELVYRSRGEYGPAGTEWRVIHYPARPASPPRVVTDPQGSRYELAAEFDHAGISGFYWAVYRNERIASGAR